MGTTFCRDTHETSYKFIYSTVPLKFIKYIMLIDPTFKHNISENKTLFIET